MATHYVSLLTSVFFLSIFFFFLFPNRLVIYQLLLIKSARSTQKLSVDARSTQKSLDEVTGGEGYIRGQRTYSIEFVFLFCLEVLEVVVSCLVSYSSYLCVSVCVVLSYICYCPYCIRLSRVYA